MKQFLVFLCSIVMIFGVVGASQADSLEWHFTNTPITVSPTDTIDVDGYLTNVSATLFSESLGMATWGPGTTFGVYDLSFNLGLLDFWDPLSLAPGDSVTFRLGTLTPIGGSAPVGMYSNSSSSLFFESEVVASTNIFEINVVSEAVPEPGTMLLIGTGLLGLVGFRRKLRK